MQLTHCQIREKPTSRVAAAAARSATPPGHGIEGSTPLSQFSITGLIERFRWI
jgi:hypothetical protein